MRRGKGEGAIYREADGRYAVQIWINGKRYATHKRTRREASEWLASVRARLAAGVDISDRSTLGDFLAHWLEVARPGLRHNTAVLYAQVLRDHVLPYCGGVRLSALRADHIQRLYSDRLAAGVSGWTIRKVHIVLRKALGDAVRWGLVMRNVMELVRLPVRARGEVAALDVSEVQRLIMVGWDDRIGVLVYLAVVTGMRLGELLGLRWSDVDWERGAVSVSRQLVRLRQGGGLAFTPVKTKSGSRLVMLGDDGLAALREQRRRVDFWRAFAGERWRDNDLVFPSSVGTPLEPRRVYGEFVALCERAGVRRVRFHDLRHTAASLALRAGVAAKVVSERLGHSSIGITLDLYSHVVSEVQREAAERVEEQIRPIVARLPG